MLPETVHVELTCGAFDLIEPPVSEVLRLSQIDETDLEATVGAMWSVGCNTPEFADAFPDQKALMDALRPSDLRRLSVAVQTLLGGGGEAQEDAEGKDGATFRGAGG